MQKPVAEGGWNVLGTDFLGAEMLYSWLNPPLPANGDKAWFGWPKDDEIDALRKAWLNKLNASESEVRQETAAEIQERAFEGPLHSDRTIFALDRLPENLRGVIKAPALLIGNVEKV